MREEKIVKKVLMEAPAGASNASIEGVKYKANDDGLFEIETAHVNKLLDFGFKVYTVLPKDKRSENKKNENKNPDKKKEDKE